jgi:hypothetical protein
MEATVNVKKYLTQIIALFFILFGALFLFGCQQAPAPSPEAPPNGQITKDYVGSDTCQHCHEGAHKGFTKTNHYNTFKPLSAYEIPDLPESITIFDTANKENPASTTIDPSKVSGVMVDHYVVAQIPESAGFKNPTYRVAALHKEGDHWALEPASTGDFNNDGTEDWGALNYTCGSCHSPGLGVSDEEYTIGCESCHGPGGYHVQAEEKAGTMTASQDACYTCHASNPTKNNEGIWEANNHYGTRNYFASKHAASRQTNDCLACHTPHKVNANGQTVIGDDPVKDNCRKCHTQEFDLEELMWVNPSDLRNHYVKDHSFGAMPYEDLGDDPATKPIEITNPEMVKIIEDKLE